jgi:predicted deacylase
MNKIEILGGKKGKNILILSGVHGNELTPVYTTYLLSKHDFSKFKFKKITIISSINYEGISKNSRDIPNTHTNDINRMFNSHQEINYEKELFKFINENDVIIDLHSSPKCDNFALLNQDEWTNSYVDFCENNNISYLIRYSNSNTIKKYCLDLNKIAFTIELNMMSYIDKKSSEKGKEIVLNIIKNINQFKLEKSEPTNSTYFEFFTHHEGLFIPNKSCGIVIREGEIIGTVINLEDFSEKKIKFNKKSDYKIICFGASDYVSSSESICYLQKIKK